jgi:hypothetical protein
MGFWGHAFHVERAADFAPTDRERELIARFAARVARSGLATPAILFLETFRPLNFVAGQGLAFFEPIVRMFVETRGYGEFARMLERRGSVEALLAAIEREEAARAAGV